MAFQQIKPYLLLLINIYCTCIFPRALCVSSGDSHITLFLQSLVQLSHLVVLDITKNKVEQFPPGLSRLAALSDLHASENCIEELPEDFGEM